MDRVRRQGVRVAKGLFAYNTRRGLLGKHVPNMKDFNILELSDK